LIQPINDTTLQKPDVAERSSSIAAYWEFQRLGGREAVTRITHYGDVLKIDELTGTWLKNSAVTYRNRNIKVT